MTLQTSIHHFIVRRGGPPDGLITSVTRSLRWRALALVGVLVLAVATVQSCATTRNADGSWSHTFAPDMVITAWGLEDGLEKLTDLLEDCMAGTWQRPCTDDEMNRIERMHERVLLQKEMLNHD